jgi:RNA polymerase sigma-70 factor, ECF subfamily
MNMDEITDAQLLGLFAKTGDVRHLDVAIVRNTGKIRGAIYAMVLNHEDADDLTQEVFLRAIENLDGFNGRAEFSSWLYRIAMNAARDFLRRKKRNPVDCPGDVPELPDAAEGPAGALLEREVHADIRDAMNGLSPSLRSAIVLTAIEGMSVREAARIDKCLPATMYWRVHQARKILKRRLAGRLPFPGAVSGTPVRGEVP